MDLIFRFAVAVVLSFLVVQWVSIDTTKLSGVSYGVVTYDAAEVTPVPRPSYPTSYRVPKVLTDEMRRELECLADNIYYEAGVEDVVGKIAVARVVMNRAEDSRFPGSTPCEVVYEGAKYPKEKAHKQHGRCQFSWLCQGKKPEEPNQSVWEESWQVAVDVYLNDFYKDLLPPNVVFYHANYVTPKRWPYRFYTQIGRHLFYIG